MGIVRRAITENNKRPMNSTIMVMGLFNAVLTILIYLII
jgi:hypothetical protein